MVRRTISTVLAALILVLGSGLMSAGCASGEDQMPVRVPEATPEDPLPVSTLARLKECAEQWADELESGSHKVRFDLTLTQNAYVREAEPKEPRLEVRGMEKCMAAALRAMFVPKFVMEQASFELRSRRVGADARRFVGQIDIMDKFLITLGPVIIEAGPVAIIITVGIVVTAAIVKSVKMTEEECAKERVWAKEHCIKLLLSPNPSRHQTGGYRSVEDCMKGFISEDCEDGNDVDWGDRPARPGRKT